MSGLSVSKTIESLLPRGTMHGGQEPYSWESFPIDPADAFGVAAILLERAGCYQYIPPNTCGFSCEAPDSGDPFEIAGANQFELRLLATAWSYDYPFEPLTDDANAEAIARKDENIQRAIERFNWRFAEYPNDYLARARHELPGITDEPFTTLWKRLISCQEPVSTDYEADSATRPQWWRDAIRLLILADEAAAGMGFITPPGKPETRWQERAMTRLAQSDSFHLGLLIDPDVAGVLPKTRTPSVGCTPRSLSHNLCLAPARGRVAVEWVPRLDPAPEADTDAFNVLLVPFPYVMRADWLEPSGQGTFKFRQKWLDGGVRNRLNLLVEQIIKDSDKPPHAIVLPEFALDWDAFSKLAADIGQNHRSVEVLLAGISDYNGIEGNFVATWLRDKKSTFVRGKHHRWKIDKHQLERYGMSGRLPGEGGWWEDIALQRRAVQFFPLRNRSVFTTLICEDLARIEPCQAIIRGVGPNLVFVLLVDGAQVASRWPNQYAGVLAEDPGSSVLTLTSLGLLSRISAGHPAGRRSVALWRDQSTLTPIDLREGEIAALLSLEPKTVEEYSIDGRSDGGAATTWRLASVVPIRQRVEQEWVYSTP